MRHSVRQQRGALVCRAEMQNRTVEVRFEAKYETRVGQSVVIVGGSPELGSWTAEKGLKMTWNPDHIWKAQLRTKKGSICGQEFKVVVMDPSAAPAWEPGYNRKVEIQDAEVGRVKVMWCEWGNDRSHLEPPAHVSILAEPVQEDPAPGPAARPSFMPSFAPPKSLSAVKRAQQAAAAPPPRYAAPAAPPAPAAAPAAPPLSKAPVSAPAASAPVAKAPVFAPVASAPVPAAKPPAPTPAAKAAAPPAVKAAAPAAAAPAVAQPKPAAVPSPDEEGAPALLQELRQRLRKAEAAMAESADQVLQLQASVDRLTAEVTKSKVAQAALQEQLRDMRAARAASAMTTLREISGYENEIESLKRQLSDIQKVHEKELQAIQERHDRELEALQSSLADGAEVVWQSTPKGKAKEHAAAGSSNGNGSTSSGSSGSSDSGISLSRSNWRTALAAPTPESHGLGSNGSNGSSKRFSW